jgi:hypothetical protein
MNAKLTTAQERTLAIITEHGTIVKKYNGAVIGGIKGFNLTAAESLVKKGLVRITNDDATQTHIITPETRVADVDEAHTEAILEASDREQIQELEGDHAEALVEDKYRTIAAGFPELVAEAAETNPEYGPARYLDPKRVARGAEIQTELIALAEAAERAERITAEERAREEGRTATQTAARPLMTAEAHITIRPDFSAASGDVEADYRVIENLDIVRATDEAGTTWISYQGPSEFVDELGRTWRRIPGLGLVCRYIDGEPSSECWPLDAAERSFGLRPVPAS